MATLATLVVKLVGDIDEYKKDIEKAAKLTSEIGQKMTSAGKTLTAGVTLPLLGIGLASIDAASDLEESMSKTNVVFGASAEAIQEFADSSAENLGMTEQAALEAAGTYGNLFNAMGVGKGPATDMSMGLVQLAADLASFNNIDPTATLDKLRAGITGEAEPLKALGVDLKQTAVQALALEMGLATTAQELTNADLVTARYAIIMEQTALAQGDFARTSEGLANSTRIMKAEIGDAAAELGEELLPIALDVVNVVSDAVDWFTSLSDEAQHNIIVMGGVAGALGPVLLVTGKLVTAGGDLVTTVKNIQGAMVAADVTAKGLLITYAPLAAALAVLGLTVAADAKIQEYFRLQTEELNDELIAEKEALANGKISNDEYFRSVNDILESKGYMVQQTEQGIRVFDYEGDVINDVTDEWDLMTEATYNSASAYSEAEKYANMATTAINLQSTEIEQYNPKLETATKNSKDLHNANRDLDVDFGNLLVPTGLLETAIYNLGASYDAANTATRLLNEGIGMVTDSMIEQERIKLVLKMAMEEYRLDRTQATDAEMEAQTLMIQRLLDQQTELENLAKLNEALDKGIISNYDWIAVLSDGVVTQEELNLLLGVEKELIDGISSSLDALDGTVARAHVEITASGFQVGNLPPEFFKEEGPVPFLQHGGQFWVNRPTPLVVGEGVEDEFVSVIPRSKMGQMGQMGQMGGGDTYNVSINDRLAMKLFLEQQRQKELEALEAMM